MRKVVLLALFVSFALAAAANAATAPETAPLFLTKGGCPKISTPLPMIAVRASVELEQNLFAPRAQTRLLPLCPGPYSCPSGCTAGGICNWGPIGGAPTDCCTLPGGGEFCCDQDKDEVWALICACEGPGSCDESQEVTLYCV